MFRKSSFCKTDTPMCVEVDLDGATVHVRDSKEIDGSVLTFTREEWRAFITGVRAGEFDNEIPQG
jgi:hypothetical protein